MENTKNRRLLRVSKSIRTELSALLLKDAKNPQLEWVQINDVDMSPDLRHAKVYYSLLNDDKATGVQKSLDSAAPFFQQKIAVHLSLKNTPRLQFFFDDTSQKGAQIDAIIKETSAIHDAMLQLSPEKLLAKMIAESEDILLCCHAKPDGDAAGSLLGLKHILNKLGKKPLAYCPDGIPQYLNFLIDANEVIDCLPADFTPEMTIMLDTASRSQFPVNLPTDENLGHFFVIDHHSSHEDFGQTIIRRNVSATGELIHSLCTEQLWPVDKETATALYVAIVTDTGSFRQHNATPGAFTAAAALVEKGAEPAFVASKIFGSFPAKRQLLFAKVASTLELKHNEKLAVLQCTQKMLDQCNANLTHLDGIINFGRDTEGVEVTIMFVERGDKQIKAGFRSAGNIDVAALASVFGGGGHKNASGASLDNVTMQVAVETVCKEAITAIDNNR